MLPTAKFSLAAILSKVAEFLIGSNRQLMLAVGTGATGAFCTYLAASVWADAENQWLATGSNFTGRCPKSSLTTLGLLLWFLWGRKNNSTEAKLDLLLADLSNSDRLKRLVAN